MAREQQGGKGLGWAQTPPRAPRSHGAWLELRPRLPFLLLATRNITDHLDLLVGVVLVASPVLGLPSCSLEGQVAIYHSCNLTRVPRVPSTTERLLLSFNSIRRVAASSFPFLEHLWLLEIGAQFTSLAIDKEAFRNLPNLRLLDLGQNRIDFLHPDAFQGLPHLSELRLFSCGLSDVVLKDGYFRNLASLSRLDLSGNQIGSLALHPSFRELSSLKTLDFSLNDIPSVCERDLQPLQGKTLSLVNLGFTHLYLRASVDWGTCLNPFRNIVLETLDVSHNGWSVTLTRNFNRAVNGSKISSLVLQHHIMGPGFGFQNLKDPDQDTFAGLAHSSLILLDLSHGSLFALSPQLFAVLKELKVLNLAFNRINQIAANAFYGLNSLQVLNMSHNLLGELYNFHFRGLPKVAYIDLQKNHIGIIQRQTFESVGSLNTLDLRDNALKTVDFIRSIDTIYLGGNKLVAVPNTISFTASFLDLSENRLENLADLHRLLQVPHLQVLILKQNRLSSCTQDLSPPKNLSVKQLFLGENLLQLAWNAGSCWDVFRGLAHLQILYLNDNYLQFLPPGVFSDLSALRGLSLSSNRLTTLSPGVFPPNLEILDVSRNHLLSPDPGVFATLRYVDLTHNKFSCECELSHFLHWLNHTNVSVFGPPDDMYCAFPGSFVGVPLYSLSTEDCDEEQVAETLRFCLFVFVTVIVTLFLLSVLVVTKCRGFCFVCWRRVWRLVFGERVRGREPDQYRYDAYLCFCGRDFEWVQNALLKRLDAQYDPHNRFHLCFEERDFVPGENHLANIQVAVWSSRKVICVVSRHFLRDGWCLEAFAHAQSRCSSNLSRNLVMVVVGPLTQYQLMAHPGIRGFVTTQQYLKWPEDLQDVEWFLNKLSQHILKRGKERRSDRDIPLQTVVTSHTAAQLTLPRPTPCSRRGRTLPGVPRPFLQPATNLGENQDCACGAQASS